MINENKKEFYKKMETKVIAMYLPQYHEIPENSQFWGQGFTDWTAVKTAKPLFEGHEQPKVPMNDNYYDLSEADSIRWQTEIANKYGIYGFGIYHYWFSDEKVLLTKPAELLLDNSDIDMHFLFVWDNISWKRTWSKIRGNDWSPLTDEKHQAQIKDESPVLVEYILGEKTQWKKHFDYLLPYFQDERYIKDENKPLFLICHYDKRIVEMNIYWNELAKENGLDGIKIVYRYDSLYVPKSAITFYYEPIYSGWGAVSKRVFHKIFKINNKNKLMRYSYDVVWQKIIRNARSMKQPNRWIGAFVNYDDTPRRGEKGRMIIDANPEKFEKYLKKLLTVCESYGKKYVFLTAWNEWGEGAYLEPDKNYGFAYLEALKKATRS